MSNSHGLTRGNILATLPVALQQDPSMVALADSIADVLANRPAEIDLLRIYSRIDELDEPLLDILAYDFHVDWWDADYSIEQKRQTLKDSWRIHRMLGTPAAVKLGISAVYPSASAEEWFEYGGTPFCFRLTVDGNAGADSEKLQRALARLGYYKSLRSHLEGIITTTTIPEAEIKVATAIASLRITPIPAPEREIPEAHIRMASAITTARVTPVPAPERAIPDAYIRVTSSIAALRTTPIPLTKREIPVASAPKIASTAGSFRVTPIPSAE